MSQSEKLNNTLKSSVTIKIGLVALLTLVLLVPMAWISTIIHEREELHSQAINDVSSKWSREQTIQGPILTIPVMHLTEYEDRESISTKHYYHFSPKQLKINGQVQSEVRKRGIYEVPVYDSSLALSGTFDIDEKFDDPIVKEVLYSESFITLGISDLRGLKNNIDFSCDNEKLELEPGSRIDKLISSGITIKVPKLKDKIQGAFAFDYNLDLQGSKNLSFVPIGQTTEVNIKSDWDSPSFMGNYLPRDREVGEAGFTAAWKILELSRNIPSSWIGDSVAGQLNYNRFGVNFLLPIDDYKKSLRSSKYAILTIALTFLVFFLVEVIKKRKIHPLQYSLVGIALCLFYVLLVSISEHLNFNLAYLVSAMTVIAMIGLYSLSVFRERQYSGLLVAMMSGLYGFLFVTIQVIDYALLMGSIGLVIILSLTMYFTRNIDWYQTEILETA